MAVGGMWLGGVEGDVGPLYAPLAPIASSLDFWFGEYCAYDRLDWVVGLIRVGMCVMGLAGCQEPFKGMAGMEPCVERLNELHFEGPTHHDPTHHGYSVK